MWITENCYTIMGWTCFKLSILHSVVSHTFLDTNLIILY
jgi:hypothetical protein